MAEVYLDGSYDVRVRSLVFGYGYASSAVHHVLSVPDYGVVLKRRTGFETPYAGNEVSLIVRLATSSLEDPAAALRIRLS